MILRAMVLAALVAACTRDSAPPAAAPFARPDAGPPASPDAAAPPDAALSDAAAAPSADETSKYGFPAAWLACERAADCAFVHREDSGNHCAPNVIPVAKQHLRDALKRYPKRPCPHGPPGHGCAWPEVSCRKGACAVRTFAKKDPTL